VCMSTGNIVDGMALFHLTNSDINLMLPGKVGAARKLTVFIESLKSKSDVNSCSHSQVHISSGATSDQMSTAVSALPTNADVSVTDLVDTDPIPSCSQRNDGIPLPVYSTRIRDVLDKGNVMLDFELFIEETAYFVIANGDMKTKDQYEDFGRRLLTAYPCLDFPGKKTSWVFLSYFRH